MKHLEKIIFLAVLVVVGGVSAWIFMGDPGGPDVSADLPGTGGAFDLDEYAGIPPLVRVEWPAPVPQDDEGNWLYRVFTPPVLYIVDGRFDPKPPKPPGPPPPPPPPPEPFGVALRAIERAQYRLQLDAIYETKLGDVESALLTFENVYASETERPTISLEKGQTSEEFDFRVEDIRKVTEIVGGGLRIEHIATITDLRTGKTVVLTDQSTLFEEGVTLVFESTVTTDQTATATTVGDTFEMNDATYTVSEINIDQSSVELVKESETLDVPEVETLTVEVATPAPPETVDTEPPTSPQVTTPKESSDFMDLFN